MKIYQEIKDLYKMIQVRVIHALALVCAKKFRPEMYNRVLILSPHPDDEIIGCAGLIQQLLKHGKEAYIVMATGGGAVWDASMIDSNELIARRRELTMAAAEIIGLPHDRYTHLGWADGRLDETVNSADRHRQLAQTINAIKPALILLPHRFEVSKDHYSLTQAVFNTLKTGNYSTKIAFYWIHSMQPLREFIAGWRKSFTVKLNSDEYVTKQRALDAYLKPLAPFGKPYSGILHKSLMLSMKWNRELFFEARQPAQ